MFCPECRAEFRAGFERCNACDVPLVTALAPRLPASELVTVVTFLNHVDADVAVNALTTAGVDAMVQADDCGGMRPHLWMGGVKVLVRAEDEEQARGILEDAVVLGSGELPAGE